AQLWAQLLTCRPSRPRARNWIRELTCSRICDVKSSGGTEEVVSPMRQPSVNPPSAQKTHNCAEKTNCQSFMVGNSQMGLIDPLLGICSEYATDETGKFRNYRSAG